MAADAGEKTEAPTPRRKQEARERGQVAKSNDLSSAVLLVGGLICLRLFAPTMMTALTGAIRENLSLDGVADANELDPGAIVRATGWAVLNAAGPVLGGLVIISLISGLIQVGPLLTLYPLTPKLDKLNPINGVKRIFSVRTLMQLLMNLVKLSVVCGVGWLVVSANRGALLLAMDLRGWAQLALMAKVLFDVGLALAGVLLVLALLDYAWQRYRHIRDLRMTKQEVKEELRRMEGDPIIKQRRRKMQLVALMQLIKSAVPKADVVVTNPTEIAVAIRYDAAEMQAPRVIAKGQGFIAERIREIAILHRVPIVERRPLAQALFKTVEVGQEVPEQFYKAIAEILAYVYELTGRRPKPRPSAA